MHPELEINSLCSSPIIPKRLFMHSGFQKNELMIC